MSLPHHQIEDTSFAETTLHGGAFDGQTVNVPRDETRLQFYDGSTPQVYHRLADGQFYSEDHPQLRAWVGGKR